MSRRALNALVGILLTCMVQPSSAAAARESGLAALYPGQTGHASDKVKARWNQISNHTLALLLQCLNQLSLQKPRAAIDYCSKALDLDPTNAGGYKLRGEAYFMAGELSRAKQEFDRAVALDPSDPQSYAGRGDTLRNMHSYRDAIRDYTQALTLAPKDERLWNSRCWARAIWGHELVVALDDCNRALTLNYEFSLAYNSRGLIYLRMNVLSLAMRDYDSAIQLLPEFPAALFGRGIAESRLGRVGAARSDMAAARRLDALIEAKYASFGIVLKKKVRPHTPLCSHKGCSEMSLTIPPRAIPRRTPAKVAIALLAGRQRY